VTDRLKVLLITGSYPPVRCGVGDYTARLAVALHQRPDVRLAVLTSALHGVPTEEAGVEVRPAMRSWRVPDLPQYCRLAREFAPDVVHLQFPTQSYNAVTGLALLPAVTRILLRVPIVETLHEYFPEGFSRITVCMGAMALTANAIVAVRPGYRERLPRTLRLLLAQPLFRFIPNASAIPAVTLTPAERAAERESIGSGERPVVAYFGFAYPHKGVERLFEIVDPRRHHLLLIGELSAQDAYHAKLLSLAASPGWKDHVTVTGYVDARRAARLLAASDAAVFPFVGGGGIWNSSLHSATDQGTFVLTTSTERHGYDTEANIYYAQPGDTDDMRTALRNYIGVRSASPMIDGDDEWARIARNHVKLYRTVLGMPTDIT
jgi:glycosyltransferase involved in cell wall biosynthesis